MPTKRTTTKRTTPKARPRVKPTPAQIEAEDIDTIEIEFKGETYVFPAALEDASGDVLDHIESQQLGKALRGLIGREEWAKFKSTNPTIKDYGELFGAFAREVGLDSLEG